MHMKLSFSTKGWHDRTFEDFCTAASDMGFEGVEIHHVQSPLFTDKNGVIHEYSSAAASRYLYEKGITIPCLDMLGDPSDLSASAENDQEFRFCLEVASGLHVPFIRLRVPSVSEADTEAAVTRTAAWISRTLPVAESAGVTLLVETSGLFARTDRLSELLNQFASDSLGALWQLSAAYFGGGEDAGTVIRHLGAYIRHIHVCDARLVDGQPEFCLAGEGELPIAKIMAALRSINYDGFLSLVWDPSWCEGLDDMELVLSQFANFMNQFDDPSRKKRTLYYNRAHTGQFVWKKDLLIDETFSGVLDRMAEEFPDQYAFKYTTLDYTRTYSEFRDDVDECARALIALGVHAGTHVAMWASNLPEWYITFWAVTKIGAVFVSVNTAYKIHEAEYLLKQSDTHTLIFSHGYHDSDYAEIMKTLCPELEQTSPHEALHCRNLPFLRHLITVGFRCKGCLSWSDAMHYASETSEETLSRMAAAVSRDDVCNMQYTSGTTGFPKGVMLTHSNVINNGKCIGDRMDLSTADRMMIQVPMFHCFGMVLSMTAAMTHGSTLLPLPYFSPKPALSCIHREHITACHGVPTMFIALLEHPDFPQTDFSHMRTGIMAGSPCPVSVMRDVMEKMNMTEITIVYGQTEASPGCTMSSTDDPIEVRVETVGHPLPEIECRIIDPDTGEECPDNVTGEFVARGYNIMKGYYKMPEATASAIDREGWLHTGDLACRTPDGNFRITGRLKDMIIRGGENIYPREIEEFLYTYPKVRDVQVIGIPDEHYGEEVMACIILKEGETATEEEIRTYMKSRLARHKVPKYIHFMDSFPMNVAGKILKYKMREDAVKRLGLDQNKGKA